MINGKGNRSWCLSVLNWSICCLAILSLGCEAGNPDGRIPLSGSVSWEGTPVEKGYILFVSTSGGKSSGGQIVDGSFELVEKKGVPRGKYKVKITANRPSGKKVPDSDFPDELIDEIEQYIPKRYNDQSDLTLEVDGPLDALSYDLKAE